MLCIPQKHRIKKQHIKRNKHKTIFNFVLNELRNNGHTPTNIQATLLDSNVSLLTSCDVKITASQSYKSTIAVWRSDARTVKTQLFFGIRYEYQPGILLLEPCQMRLFDTWFDGDDAIQRLFWWWNDTQKQFDSIIQQMKQIKINKHQEHQKLKSNQGTYYIPNRFINRLEQRLQHKQDQLSLWQFWTICCDEAANAKPRPHLLRLEALYYSILKEYIHVHYDKNHQING